MSIFAMNWALRQRLDSPNAQILLYVIADSADATGKTTHCDPDYMADRARMSRPTLYRRLGELEEIGLLQRFKSYSEHGAQVYEIRLNFDALVDMPIRGRRSDDDDGSADDAKTHGQMAETGEGGERPKSHNETLVCTAKVSPVRQPESHSGDFQEGPPISKDSPLPPEGGGVDVPLAVQQAQEPEHFAEFWQAYLGHEVMPRGRALAVFNAMTVSEREHARAAALLLSEQLTKMKRKPKNAHTWLADRGWLEFPNARLAQPAPSRLWIAAEDAVGLGVALGMVGRELRLLDDPERGRGLWRPAELDRDLAALAKFAGTDREAWPVVQEGSQQFAAWRDRLQHWLGVKVETEKVWLEPYNAEVHGRSATDPAFKLRASVNGLRVPTLWPPRKDGTISEDQQGAA